MLNKIGGKGKEKEMNLIPIHEDEELDEMGGFDSGNLPTIDTLDEDDDDIGDEDLSWNILVICVQFYLLFCDLVVVFLWKFRTTSKVDSIFYLVTLLLFFVKVLSP